uniref:CKLF like MARVEL transmembrane domain containing 1 n=1 Tax=Propithecus coquereli TaxID=379532 RepID=A0A2K6EJD8_PROCO
MEPKDTKREFAKTLPANLQPEPPTPPDLINSIISAVFLLVVAILTMREKERRHLFYVGGRQ